MNFSLRTMVECRWTARRLQRYLDADPAALLSAYEVDRLEAHLAVCEQCGALTGEYRRLRRGLGQLALQRRPDPDLVARVHAGAEQLTSGEST
jgi:predicted anti-sigma-YlaC factor YlaD